jgi:hypothetical protein
MLIEIIMTMNLIMVIFLLGNIAVDFDIMSSFDIIYKLLKRKDLTLIGNILYSSLLVLVLPAIICAIIITSSIRYFIKSIEYIIFK